MTKNEAMQQALVALENHEGNYKLGRAGCERQEKAITAIKEALAQPVQEDAFQGWVKIDELREHFNAVNCGTIYRHGGEGRVPLYTTPPQRKPLDDWDIDAIRHHIGVDIDSLWARKFARAIEAAHGIKGDA